MANEQVPNPRDIPYAQHVQQPQPQQYAQQQYTQQPQQYGQQQYAQQQYARPAQQYGQQPYGQPQQYAPQVRQNPDSSLTFGSWMVTLLLMFIPIVNIIMLFIWGFGSTTAPAKKNFARAYLVWMLIIIVIEVIAFAVLGVSMNSIIDNLNY